MSKEQEVRAVKLPKTLMSLQGLRTVKSGDDNSIHKLLDTAYAECKKVDMVLMLERVMLHIGDISRQHNLLSEMGIKSPTGGAQERANFRSIIRWWSKTLPASFAKNIRAIVDFSVLENIMYYQNTTDRYKGNVINKEVLFPDTKIVYTFLINQIRAGKGLNLIAKHLPKYNTGLYRTTKKVIKPRDGVASFNWSRPEGAKWVKLNGVLIDEAKINVKAGDVVSYPRKKQEATLTKEKFINIWIKGFCEAIGWNVAEYKTFRSTQNTAEQKMASKSVLNMPKSDFMEFLDGLTSGQRYRVAKTVCSKDGDKLVPREKWLKLGGYYNEWESNQTKVADKLRTAAANNDEHAKVKLMKEFKVKATGVKTIDLLADMLKMNQTSEMINNSYQALVEKMDLIANVFVVLDGSASMNGPLVGGWTRNAYEIDAKYSNLQLWHIAAAMGVTFSTRNPNMAFRNTFGWFSNNFKIIGKSNLVNNAPNRFVDRNHYSKKVNEYNILSEKNTFIENFNSLNNSNPGHGAGTNMFASIEYFVQLIKDGKVTVEDLPNAILYITDNENNTGKSPKQALELAYSIGWSPLLIFWGLKQVPERLIAETKGLKNILFIGGFSEGVLSQILRGIKSGSVDPEDELWSIYDDMRYSVIK